MDGQIPKSEARNPKQTRNPNARNRFSLARFDHSSFGHSDLFRISDFEFQISCGA